jgi:LAO/AO transport system kinase
LSKGDRDADLAHAGTPFLAQPPHPFALSLSKGASRAAVDPDPDQAPDGRLAALLAPPGPAQRRAIAKAITLLESTRPDHRAQADALLTALLPHTGRSFRLGISGVPGVGKSTFIEALGLFLIERGHRVAVLAVDPSSSVSGGSILGDKTRMERLSVDERAFIRPSPAAGNLGGVAEKTREAMLVCEAAGHDIVIVETVGVGQSETAVAGMTDLFCLLQLPNAGDDLQAIKKGVMELADLVVINKADLDTAAATRAQAQITSALRLLGLHGRSDRAHHDDTLWHPQVLQLSALHGQGLDAFWAAVSRFRELQTASGRLTARRRAQDQAWLWERIEAGLRQRFREHPAVREALPQALADVQAGRMAPSVAARRLLDGFGRRDPASSTFPADPATSASPSPPASGASDASDASPD